MSGISRQSAVFFQTEDFSSVFFNTFLGCNRLGDPMHPLSSELRNFCLQATAWSLDWVGKKQKTVFLSIDIL